MARKKKTNLCAECDSACAEDDFLCLDCRTRKRAEAAAKAAQTRARNAAIREAEERARVLASKRQELEQITITLPSLYDEYTDLMDTLSQDNRFDRKKWNRLDRIQNGIIGYNSRKRTLITELEMAA